MNERSGAGRDRRFRLGLAMAILIAPLAAAQTRSDMTHFEVVSVRAITAIPEQAASELGKCTGGPGTQDPILWVCHLTNRTALINLAFGAEVYQFLPTDSIALPLYSVSARVPPNAKKEQFHEMLRNMLEERFNLTWHWRESDATVYRLVRDPEGVKFHESPPNAPPAVAIYGAVPGATPGKDRYPVFPDGVSGLTAFTGHNRWRSSNVTTADIAYLLRWEFRTDVTDETGLTGHYDVDLRWQTPLMEILPAAPPYDGPDAKTEFRNKLGLVLEPVKGKIKTFVVEHIDKVPTAN